MKKYLYAILLAFGFLVMGFSVWQVRAEEDVLGDQTESVIQEVDPVRALIEQEVLYYLPYPGILPDHPIYWMKMFRDRVVEILTTKTDKRVDLWVLYADKRLGAAKVLIEGNKIDLGVLTALKSTGYLSKAVYRVEEIKNQGIEVGNLANKMERETLKHAQVLDELARRTEGDAAGKMNNMRDEALKLHQKMLVILGRN